MATETLRLLVYPEGDVLIGQCLEHDVCVRGRDIEEVRRRLKLSIFAHAEDESDFYSLPPAPAKFHAEWDALTEPPKRVRVDSLPVTVELRSTVAA